ncbi:ABC transporter permease subunit [Heyndrickxia sp. NPDC080065]|uniref:carbohydrate ABC transporter permease n=1 Tax=Heyndrickxia sp. NPDC080065 TaxID=3390568 RepID=UPI003CFE9DC7
MRTSLNNDPIVVKTTSYGKKAALLGIIPGLGQIYNRQFIKGGFFFGIMAYLVIFWRVPFQYAMWGLSTLGETPQRIEGFDTIKGDHSIFLMIDGIIYLISFLLLLWVYYLTIRDAYKVGNNRELGIQPNSFKKTLLNIWENGFPYILLTPSILFTAFLTILPLLFGILIAFTNYSSPNHIPPRSLVDWVGFDSFIGLFKLKSWSQTFYSVFSWTVIWAILSTATTFFLGLIFAVLINKKGIKFKKIWRSIFILPWAIPQFISILIFRIMFNGQFGPINNGIRAIGDMLANTHIPFLVDLAHSSYFVNGIPWLSDPFWAKFSLVAVNMWFGFPYWMILMSGVMTSIDKEMYEAADVDGATAWEKFRKITLPIVMFSTAPLLIMSFAGNFNNFNMIYLFTKGSPVIDGSTAGSTDILISWIYKLTLDLGQYNMASVVSILIFLVIAVLSIWNFRRTKAFKEEDMMS